MLGDGLADDTDDVLTDDVQARYGHLARPGRSWWRRVAVVAGIAVALTGFLWWAVGATREDVRWQVLTFTTGPADRTTVTFEVYGRAGDTVRCAVRASTQDRADAGQVVMDVGPLPDGGRARTATEIRTIAPAVAVEVRTCAVVPDGLQ